MENAIKSATLKKAIWRVSTLTAALCLLLSINAMAQLDSKKTSTPIVIDGSFTDCAWGNANFVTFTNAVAGVPTLAATTTVSAITNTTATSGGNVTYDGGTSVMARGVCWATTANPTTANSKTTNGTGTGTFTSSLTGLTLGTTYYVRAYATNTTGTGYGAQTSFITTGGGGGYHAPAPTNSLVVNVLNTGATPNDGTDDTYAIQQAINQVAGTGGTVLVPAGTYWVNYPNLPSYSILDLKSNMTFKMETGAIIKMIPSNQGSYWILHASTCTNLNIVGGTIQGERDQHIPTTYNRCNCLDQNGQNYGGEGGYGIYIDLISSNVYVDGVTSKDNWGDGFTVGGGGGGNSTNVNLYNCVATNNRRQGASLCEMDGGSVRGCTFQTTDGAWPNDGIDIEPYNDGERANNIQIIGNQFIGNHANGIMLSGKPGYVSNITLNNNTFNSNGQGYFAAINWVNAGTGSSYSGNTFINSGSNGDIVFAYE